MSCSVIFSSKAAKEIHESFVWYEEQTKGLGHQFIEIIDFAIELIKHNPDGFPNKRNSYREAVLKRFPYIIVYEHLEAEQVIFVLHIFHTKRHPKKKYKFD